MVYKYKNAGLQVPVKWNKYASPFLSRWRQL